MTKDLTPLASSQLELEQIAQQQKRVEILRQDTKLSEKLYFSATKFGRGLLQGRLVDPDTNEPVQVITYLSQEIHEKLLYQSTSNGHVKTPGYKLLVEAIGTIAQAIDKSAEYAGREANVLDMLAVMTLKVLIDPLGLKSKRGDEGKWPSIASVTQRLGDIVDLQRADAFVSIHSDEQAYRNQRKRWTRKHQGIGNAKTNIVLGQNQLLDTLDSLEFERWTKDQRIKVGEWLLQIALNELNHVERVDSEPQKGHKYGIACLRPKAHLLQKYPEVLEKQCRSAITGYPLIEPPLEWVHDEFTPGNKNKSGGFHSAAARDFSPMVRGRYQDNTTIISEKGVSLLNILGQTKFKVDEGSCAAFDWAYTNKKDITSVPRLPEITSKQLQIAAKERKAWIAENGGVSPEGWRTGSKQHLLWKEQQKELYKSVIKLEKKSHRTSLMHKASTVIRDFDDLYFSWSADYRGRMYCQQPLMQPQGSAVERAFLRFAQGEQVTEESLVQIHQAIGAAFIGNKGSLKEREQWSIDNIDRIIDTLDGSPEDIHTVEHELRAHEPWDALQLVNCYKRSVIGNELWDVPIATDASQSGTQLLSGLLKDEFGLINTNVIVSDDSQEDQGPVDGYEIVAQTALSLLDATPEELIQMTDKQWAKKYSLTEDPALANEIRNLLTHESRRKLAKKISMPKVYGSTHQSGAEALATCIAKDLGIDLKERVKAHTDLDDLAAWKYSQTIVNTLTSYLSKAVDLVYPKAMASLRWLKALATKALTAQLEGRDPVHLSWKLSDGTVIDYQIMKHETSTINMLQLGKFKISKGLSSVPNVNDMIKSFAPGFVHSLDALLLREALHDFDGPVVAIHDCLRVLPSRMVEVKTRIKEAFIRVCEDNPLGGLAEQMGVDSSELPPLTYGDADLSRVLNSKYIFH